MRLKAISTKKKIKKNTKKVLTTHFYFDIIELLLVKAQE